MGKRRTAPYCKFGHATTAPPQTSPLRSLLPPLSAAGRASAGWWNRPIPARVPPTRTMPAAHVPCRAQRDDGHSGAIQCLESGVGLCTAWPPNATRDFANTTCDDSHQAFAQRVAPAGPSDSHATGASDQGWPPRWGFFRSSLHSSAIRSVRSPLIRRECVSPPEVLRGAFRGTAL
jgi:hypothetical protein